MNCWRAMLEMTVTARLREDLIQGCRQAGLRSSTEAELASVLQMTVLRHPLRFIRAVDDGRLRNPAVARACAEKMVETSAGDSMDAAIDTLERLLLSRAVPSGPHAP